MYSKYIGRVGALAVALGIGGAIATAPGVAWADEPSSSSASDESAGSTAASSASDESAGSTASSSASDESSASTSSASNSSSTRPTSTTPSEQSSDDDTGGPVSQSGASISSSEIVTNDESGVIVRSSGGSHTSGIDNQTVRGSQDDEAAAPDLEQPTSPEEEVALQAPPETQVTTPPAAPTRTVAPTKKNSDTKKVAPLTASTQTVAPIEKNSDTKKVAPGLQIGCMRSSAVTATAGENDEWNDQSGGATFTTPPASAPSAPKLVDLIDDDLAPFQEPGPMGPDSSVMWAALGWAHRRQFTERFANHTPVADLAQTTQVEPLGPAQAVPVEGVSALGAVDPAIDAGVAADQVALVAQVGLVAKAAPVEGVSALGAVDPAIDAGVAAEQVAWAQVAQGNAGGRSQCPRGGRSAD